MIFTHTIDLILCDPPRKSQTRRACKLGDVVTTDAAGFITAVVRGGRRWVYVGQTLAVQRGRGKPAEGRVRVTGIRRERARDITPEDAQAEGVLFATDDRIEGAGLMPVLLAIRDERRHERFCGWRFADVGGFAVLWERIHGRGSFERDEVYALTFVLVGGGT